LGSNLTKEGVTNRTYDPRSFTGGASFGGIPALGSVPSAGIALAGATILYGLANAGEDVGQGDDNLGLDVFAIAAGASACLLPTARGTAKKGIKQVRNTPASKEIPRPRLFVGRTKLVVASASLVIAQDGVSLAYFLKFLFGRGVVGVDVRMQLTRELAVCRLDLISLGIP
jgi:hypothetical protein